MKFAFSLTGLSPRHYPAVAQEAEAAGFESVWVPDHLVLPIHIPASYLYTESGESPIGADMALYDPWVLLGAIAAVTTTIRLGTNVYVLPLRHPVVTARAVLTVDRIARGRVTLGAGVGWLREEFGVVGESAANRGKRTDEIIGLLRALWSDEVIEHRGPHYSFPPVRFEPKPFQQPIPIEIGGTSKAALERAGTLGDGWIDIGTHDEEDFRAMRAVVQQARVRAGREDQPFLVTGSGACDLESIKRATELGVDRVMVRPDVSITSRVTKQVYTDTVARLADEVISRLGT